MKQVLLCAVLCCTMLLGANTANAQTSLAAGDIAFTGINADDNTVNGTPADDDFSFIILKPGGISANTEIYFTDAGWRTDANAFQSLTNQGSCSNPSQSGAVGDGIIKWTSTSALAFGTQVMIRCKFNVSASVGTAVGVQATYNTTVVSPANTDEYMTLSTGADQVIAYQGTFSSPTLIAIIHMSTAWSTSLLFCDFTSGSTSLPSALSSYNQLLGTGLDNAAAQYSKISAAVATGTQSGAYAILSNMSNWSFDNAIAFTLPPAPAGCSVTASVTSQTNVACNGGATGSLTVTPTGGTTPYTYSWTPSGGTGATASGLAAGTYTVTVTDAASCTATASATVTQPTAISITTASQTNIACNGGSNGAASINVPTGGAGGYSYDWAPGSPIGDGSRSVGGLTAGSWTCVVTDANACTASRTFTVTQPTAVSGTTVITNVACNGGSTGAINLTPAGGTPGYTFNWLPSGPTTEDRTGLTAGTYTVQITDANGCTGTVNATLTQPTALSGSTIVTNVACNGGSTGAINLTPAGGTPGYTFNWLPSGPTTEDRTGLTAGTYTVQITDANGCTGTVNATLTQPTALSGSTIVTNVACNGGSNGAINLTPAGGTPGYTFNWLPSGPTTEDRTGLTAGTYTVQITDANGCTGTVNATLTQPTALSGSTIVTNVACNGGSNGAINLTPAGGTGPYTFNWLPSGPTTEDRTGLTAGTYTVQITDANGCTGTVNTTVTQPASAVSGSTVVTNVACNGGNNGAINLTPTGGTPGYTFNWLPSGPTTEDRTGLTAGTYTVQITDANGCTGTVNTTVTQPTALNLTAASQTNIACNGGSSGAAAVNTATGGAGGYTYNWTPGNPTGDGTVSVTGLTAGSWTCQVTDANACTASQTFTVTQPTALNLTAASQTNIACNGGSNGAATVNAATGGAGGYTYNWTPGNPTGDGTVSVTGLTAGSWTCQVTDANACTASQVFTVTQPSALNLTAASQTNIACNGGSSGAAAVNAATGGAGGYTYNWTPGNPTGDGTVSVTGLTAGSWTCQVTDANACTASQTFTVTQPSALNLTPASQTNIACNGGSSGAATVNAATGGAGGYTYNWTPGNPTGDGTVSVTGLTAGSWTCQVTDANACTASRTFTVTQPTALNLTAASQTNIACNGGSNGAATVNAATGGAGGYTYNWTPGNPTGDGTVSVTGLTAGSWTCQVTDANACSASQTFTVTQPSALNLTPASQTNIACNGGSSGAATVNAATGGAGGYTYNWTPGNPTGDGTVSVTGLTAGSWTCQVTDANACTASQTFTVTQPTALNLTPASQTNISCFGGSSGAAAVNAATGGAGGYTYNWTPGNPTGDGTVSVTGLTAGSWTCQVTDANACSASQTFTVTQPTALNLTAASQTNIACNGGSSGAAAVNAATGGAGGYTYNWTPGNPTGDGTVSVTGLTAGSWTCQVTDANACTASQVFTIADVGIPITFNADSGSNSNCYGDTTGSIYITVTSTNDPYTYVWSNGETTQDITGLATGNYVLTITDGTGCTLVVNNFNISGPSAPLSITLDSITNNLCYGGTSGSVYTTALGGSTPYQYVWSNGGNTDDINNLIATTYTLTVVDDNGCTVAPISATLTDPDLLNVLVDSFTNVSCNGGNNGAIAITASGGTTPYTYTWSNTETTEDITGLIANTYTVTVTDANACSATVSALVTEPNALATTITPANVSCNGGSNGSVDLLVTGGTNPYTYLWSNSEISEDLSNVTAGVYTVTITDNNGCSTTATATVTEPTAIVATVTVSNVSCNGGNDGAVDLTVSGGTPGYTYLWSNTGTTEDISALTTGTYTVTVTDANSCTATATATITEPAALTTSTTTTTVTCNTGNDGTIDLTVTGGTTAYTYVWSNTATTQDITGLSAGTYSVTVTDAHGCSITATETVVEPTAIAATSSVTDVLCHGGSNGAIDVSVTGGAPGSYNYAWDNSATTEDITGLVAGSYNVTITDDNGCTAAYGPVTITEPDTIVGTLDSLFNVSCFGNSTGAIYVSVMGGVIPYTYEWSNGATTEDLVGVPTGIYTGTVTDANGCSIVSPAIPVTEPLAALNTVSDSVTNNLCFGGNIGAIYTTTTGGTSPYSYVWDNTETTDDITGLTAGTYTLMVTDNNGCTVVLSETTGEPQQLVATTTATNISCNGLTDGSIDVTVTGGISPYTFVWDNTETTEDITGLAAGTYTVTVTDLNGCTVTAVDNVTEPTQLIVAALTTNANCESGSDGAIDLSVNGGTPTYVFTWSSGDTTEDVTGLTIGVYETTITDANGCSVTISDTIAFTHTDPIVTLGADTTQCGGSVTLDAQHAGNGTYLWNDSTTAQTLLATVSGTYNVMLTDTNGCTGTDTIDVTINDIPVVTFDIVGDTLCLNASAITLTATPAGGTFAGAGVTGTSFNPTTAGAGVHTVTYSFTDNNGCSATAADSVLVDPCLGIENINTLSSIRMYPNPNNGSFVIVATGTTDVKCSLTNDLGQIIKEFELTSSNNYTYGLTNVESGAYFVVCRQGNATFTQKVIVIK